MAFKFFYFQNFYNRYMEIWPIFCILTLKAVTLMNLFTNSNNRLFLFFYVYNSHL